MYTKLFVCLTVITAICFIPSSVVAQASKKAKSSPINTADSVKDIIIHQEINFKVSPRRVYQSLLSSKIFSDCTKKSFDMFTTNSAKIDSAVGGVFSVFDGHIIGRILELVPNKRIVEAWRVVDWPEGMYSIVRFEFKQEADGTTVIFDHIGFPEGLKGHLSIGWQEHYWAALIKYFQ